MHETSVQDNKKLSGYLHNYNSLLCSCTTVPILASTPATSNPPHSTHSECRRSTVQALVPSAWRHHAPLPRACRALFRPCVLRCQRRACTWRGASRTRMVAPLWRTTLTWVTFASSQRAETHWVRRSTTFCRKPATSGWYSRASC